MPLNFLFSVSNVHRKAPVLVSCIILTLLPGCASQITPSQYPVAVTQLTQRSATIRPGESTRDNVRAAFGEPWLQSRFWGFDLYRADDTLKELYDLVLPITVNIEGYVLVTYDKTGRVGQVTSGIAHKAHRETHGILDSQPMMLRAGELRLGVEYFKDGPLLMADASRRQDYLELRRRSASCTLILACADMHNPGRQNESGPYPDRIAIDDAEPIDPQPFLGMHCNPIGSCQPPFNSSMVQLVNPISLPPGHHRLVITSSTYKGQHETSFECSPDEVRYGIIRGHVNWDRWHNPRNSTLETAISFEEDLPPQWASYSILLYRHDHWLAEPEPDRN